MRVGILLNAAFSDRHIFSKVYNKHEKTSINIFLTSLIIIALLDNSILI